MQAFFAAMQQFKVETLECPHHCQVLPTPISQNAVSMRHRYDGALQASEADEARHKHRRSIGEIQVKNAKPTHNLGDDTTGACTENAYDSQATCCGEKMASYILMRCICEP